MSAARMVWQGFHWTFFIDVQGLVLSLARFSDALARGCMEGAGVELRSAATLLRASGAAMQLAGSFAPVEYADDVRVSMTPPGVRADNFSGLMSWDHARLMRLWQELSPRLGDLPAALDRDHEEFVQSFVSMITSHREVCRRFVGEEDTSLRSSDCAVGILDKVLRSRLRLIDPQKRHSGGCPFSGKEPA
jgi:hypothetical protein